MYVFSSHMKFHIPKIITVFQFQVPTDGLTLWVIDFQKNSKVSVQTVSEKNMQWDFHLQEKNEV